MKKAAQASETIEINKAWRGVPEGEVLSINGYQLMAGHVGSTHPRYDGY
jgi:hypothetical protein